jgi:hypothetical protein
MFLLWLYEILLFLFLEFFFFLVFDVFVSENDFFFFFFFFFFFSSLSQIVNESNQSNYDGFAFMTKFNFDTSGEPKSLEIPFVSNRPSTFHSSLYSQVAAFSPSIICMCNPNQLETAELVLFYDDEWLPNLQQHQQ